MEGDESTQSAAPATGEGESQSTPATTPTGEPSTPAPAATTPDWKAALDTVDPKDLSEVLRTHPRVRGIVGTELQRARDEERRRVAEEQKVEAERAKEEELRALARNSPLDFAEKWLDEDGKRAYQQQLQTLASRERTQLAEQIGRAMRDSEHFKVLDEDDQKAIASALVGLPDDQVLPVFNKVAFERALAKGIQRGIKDWQEKELSKEREALRTEESAKLLKGSSAPSTAPPKGAPSGNPAAMSDQDFARWWKNRYGR